VGGGGGVWQRQQLASQPAARQGTAAARSQLGRACQRDCMASAPHTAPSGAPSTPPQPPSVLLQRHPHTTGLAMCSPGSLRRTGLGCLARGGGALMGAAPYCGAAGNGAAAAGAAVGVPARLAPAPSHAATPGSCPSSAKTCCRGRGQGAQADQRPGGAVLLQRRAAVAAASRGEWRAAWASMRSPAPGAPRLPAPAAAAAL